MIQTARQESPRLVTPVVGIPGMRLPGRNPGRSLAGAAGVVAPPIFNWKQRVRVVEAIRNAPVGALVTIPTIRTAVTPATTTAQGVAQTTAVAQSSAVADAVGTIVRSAQISTTQHPPRIPPPRTLQIRIRPPKPPKLPKLPGGRRKSNKRSGVWSSKRTEWNIVTPKVAFFG